MECLYKTKGNVGITEISKYGMGIKCAAHCIEPNGRLILGLCYNGSIHIAVYNQSNLTTINPNTPTSKNLVESFNYKFEIYYN